MGGMVWVDTNDNATREVVVAFRGGHGVGEAGRSREWRWADGVSRARSAGHTCRSGGGGMRACTDATAHGEGRCGGAAGGLA
jgi:hypothetical protein